MKNHEKTSKNLENQGKHEFLKIFSFPQKPSGVRLMPPGHAYANGKDCWGLLTSAGSPSRGGAWCGGVWDESSRCRASQLGILENLNIFENS